MRKLIVVNNPTKWKIPIEGVEFVSSKEYLTNPNFAKLKNVKVFNLSQEYRYQSRGYYVSLLAEARGHKPVPDVKNLLDMKINTLVKTVSDSLDNLIQKSLSHIKSSEFTLSIYFGQNVAKQYKVLANEIHRYFQAPLLRAKFTFNKRWVLHSVKTISTKEIPEEHFTFVQQFAKDYFNKKRYTKPREDKTIYDLAILINHADPAPPSNKMAIQKFVEAAESLDFNVEIITGEDYNRLPAFDALFIRENTHVNNETYRFARRAQSEGLAVIDSPDVILKCNNKVYLSELLSNAKIATPKTLIIHQDNRNTIVEQLGLPVVLKLPDSTFSMGVKKASTEEELKEKLDKIFEQSDLVIAQEFLPTPFDWRIGVIDGKATYACKYYMAQGHWQIYNWEAKKEDVEGDFETLDIENTPKKVVDLALKATALFGKGLFGVDIKEINNEPLVIEVNENPNIDFQIEDQILKDDLYKMIIQALKNRIEEKIGIKDGK